jgi:3-deoxy-D-manno-octulosonic-acid transferase
MNRLYNTSWLAALPGIVSYLSLRRLLAGKYRRNLRPRFGLDLDLPEGLGRNEVIWVHALSVGEVTSVLPLVRLLREEYPSYELVFSTATESGNELARERLAGIGCPVFYLPLDLWWAVRRVVERVGARLFLLVETDFWPNLLGYLRRRGTRTVLVNGRISDRSFPRYRLFRPFLRSTLSQVSRFCMQGEEDARRLLALGAQPDRVCVTGNLKLDQAMEASPDEERTSLRHRLGWLQQGPVWIAGSTHPGEEEIILRVFGQLRRRFAELCLIVAPRHPDRAGDVAALAQGAGWKTGRRSLVGAADAGTDVFVLDTIGELAGFYSLGTFAFVGGSLVPSGGHNPVESAQRGLPVVFGPHMTNFRDIAAILRESGGGFQVANEAALAQRLERWLEALEVCAQDGERAKRALQGHRGAARRTMEVIGELLQ